MGHLFSLNWKFVLFFLWRNSPTRAYAASLLQFLDHTKLGTHKRWDSYERAISLSQRQTPTQKKTHTQEKDLHSLTRILIRDPSKEAAVDPDVRTETLRDWRFV